MIGIYNEEKMKDLLDLYHDEGVFETVHVTTAANGGLKMSTRVNGSLIHEQLFTRTELAGLIAMLDECRKYSMELYRKEQEDEDDGEDYR